MREREREREREKERDMKMDGHNSFILTCDASLTLAMTSPVVGFSTSNTFPSAAFTNSLLMNS